MAHLTKPTQYDIQDSNIALLGSDLEKHIREHAGDKESAWETAGLNLGIQIWRIEKFHVVPWPKERVGSFYDGDSYIVLHTYKKTPESKTFSYDLHFWLGGNTTQDEAGTAAYKTVELDDHLNGIPVQYREIQGYESHRFLTYFPRFICLKGGIETGFHHISEPPKLNLHNLYRISTSASSLIIRQVPSDPSSLTAGDVFVLDKGTEIWQFNTSTSAGKERFKAAEFVQSLVDERKSRCEVTVFDQGSSGAGIFLAEFGEGITLHDERQHPSDIPLNPTLYRISDASGSLKFELIGPATFSSLSSSDAFLLDNTSDRSYPAVYVWIGDGSSLTERRLAPQYAQRYLHERKAAKEVAVPIVKMKEGCESEAFLDAVGVRT